MKILRKLTSDQLRRVKIMSLTIVAGVCFNQLTNQVVYAQSGQVVATSILQNGQYLPDGSNLSSTINGQSGAFIEGEELTGAEKQCESWLFAGGNSSLSDTALGIALALLLMYVFLGIAVITDVLMDAITKITSRTETVKVKDLKGKTMDIQVPIWNPRVANVTLLALGAAAPEIFLCFFSTFADVESAPKDIGPMALIGSASFNLLVVTGTSIMAVTQVKRVLSISTFIVTALFASFAYLWLFVVLVVFSPAYIELWEAVTTLLFYPLLLFFVWATEKCASENQSQSDELESNRRMICKQSLMNLAKTQGKMHVIDMVTGQSTSASSAEADHATEYFKICLGVESLANTSVDELLQVLEPENPVDRLMYRAEAKGIRSQQLQKITASELIGKSDEDEKRNQILGFQHMAYAVSQKAGTLTIRIVKHVREEQTFIVRTIDGSAVSSKQFDGINIKQTMKAQETEKEIYVKINENLEQKSGLNFKIVLLNDQEQVQLDGIDSSASITILENESAGIVGFKQSNLKATLKDKKISVVVRRIEGATGEASIRLSTQLENYEDFGAGIQLKTIKNQLIAFNENQVEALIDINLPQLKKDSTDVKSLTLVATLSSPNQAELSQQNKCIIEIKPSSNDKVVESHKHIESTIARQEDPTWGAQFKNACSIRSTSKCGKFNDCISVPWKLMCALIPPRSFLGGWAAFVMSFVAIGFVSLLVMEITMTIGCLFNLRSGIQSLVILAIGLSIPDLSLSKSAARSPKNNYADASIGLASATSAASIFIGLGLPWTIASSYHWMKYGEAFYVGKFETADMAFALAIFGSCALISFLILGLRRQCVGGEIGGQSRFFSGTILFLLWVVFIVTSNLNSYGYFGRRDIFVPETQIKAIDTGCSSLAPLQPPVLRENADGKSFNISWDLQGRQKENCVMAFEASMVGKVFLNQVCDCSRMDSCDIVYDYLDRALGFVACEELDVKIQVVTNTCDQNWSEISESIAVQSSRFYIPTLILKSDFAGQYIEWDSPDMACLQRQGFTASNIIFQLQRLNTSVGGSSWEMVQDLVADGGLTQTYRLTAASAGAYNYRFFVNSGVQTQVSETLIVSGTTVQALPQMDPVIVEFLGDCSVLFKWKTPPLSAGQEVSWYNLKVKGRSTLYSEIQIGLDGSICGGSPVITSDGYNSCNVRIEVFTQAPWFLEDGDELKVKVNTVDNFQRQFLDSEPNSPAVYIWTVVPYTGVSQSLVSLVKPVIIPSIEGSNEGTVTWAGVSRQVNLGQYHEVWYRLQSGTFNGATWQKYAQGYLDINTNINGLFTKLSQPLELYEYQVRSFNSCGYSETRFYSQIGTTATGLPRFLRMDIQDQSCSVLVTWFAPKDTGSYTYAVQTKSVSQQSWTPITSTYCQVSSGQRDCVLDKNALATLGHTSGYDFRVQVSATDLLTGSVSQWSEFVYPNLRVGNVPPQLPPAIVLNNNLITWQTSTDGTTDKYRVEDQCGNTICSNVQTTSCPILNVTPIPCSPIYRVRAENGCGEGMWSTYNTIIAVSRPVISSVSVNPNTDCSMTSYMSFTSDSDPINTLFEIQNSSTGAWTAVNCPLQFFPTGTGSYFASCIISLQSLQSANLSSGQLVQVRGTIESNQGTSLAVSANPSLFSATTPEYPTGLVIENRQANSPYASIRWNNQVNAQGYQLQYSSANTNNWITVDVTNFSTQLTNLIPGQSYNFRVYSKGPCGNLSGPSPIVSSMVAVWTQPIFGLINVYTPNCSDIFVYFTVPEQMRTTTVSYSYTVLVQNKQRQYQSVNCAVQAQGGQAQCRLDSSSLTNFPFNLIAGDQIFLQIQAQDALNPSRQTVVSTQTTTTYVQECEINPQMYNVVTAPEGCSGVRISWFDQNFGNSVGFVYEIKIFKASSIQFGVTSTQFDVTNECQSQGAFTNNSCVLSEQFLRLPQPAGPGFITGDTVGAIMRACTSGLKDKCSNFQDITSSLANFGGRIRTNTYQLFSLNQPRENAGTLTFDWSRSILTNGSSGTSTYQMYVSNNPTTQGGFFNAIGSSVASEYLQLPIASISSIYTGGQASTGVYYFKVKAVSNDGCNAEGFSTEANYSPPRAPLPVISTMTQSCSLGTNGVTNNGSNILTVSVSPQDGNTNLSYALQVLGRSFSGGLGGVTRTNQVSYQSCQQFTNTCIINMDDLAASPFFLVPGEPVEIQIQATDVDNGTTSGYNPTNSFVTGQLIVMPLTRQTSIVQPQIDSVTAGGQTQTIIRWSNIPGLTLELQRTVDNTNFQPVQPTSPNQYVVPTTGQYSRMQFRLFGKSTDGCYTIASEITELIYQTKPGPISHFHMVQTTDCDVAFDWGIATPGTGNFFQYVIEILYKDYTTGTLQEEWRTYPGCGQFGSTLNTCNIPMITFRTYYKYEIGDSIEARIYARTDAGNGPILTSQSSILVKSAPGAVAMPNVLNPQTSPLVVSWNPNGLTTDNVTYQLFWDQGNQNLLPQQFVALSTQSDATTFTVDDQTAQSSALQSTTIRFVVKTFNQCGQGDFSPVLSVYRATEPGTIPLEIYDDGCVVRFRWAVPASNGGSPITSYNLQVQANDFSTVQFSNVSKRFVSLPQCEKLQSQADAQNYFSCTVPMSELISNFNMQYGDFIVAQVNASNGVGPGPYTAIQSTFALIIVPERVSQPELLSLQGNQIIIRWNPLFFGSNQNAFLLNAFQYEVAYDQNGSGNFVTSDWLPAGQQTIYPIQKVDNDRTYHIKVRAKNACGPSEYSPTLVVNIAQRPGQIQISSVQIGCSIQFQWQRPIDNGADIISYKLEVQTRNTLDGGRSFGWSVVPNCGTFVQQQFGSVLDTPTCTVPMSTFINAPFILQQGDEIVVQGAAQNSQGWGEYSEEHISPVALTSAPGTMTDIRVVSQPSSVSPSINLAWDPIASSFVSSNIGDIVIYELYWDSGSGQQQWQLLNTTPSTQYVITQDQLAQVGVREYSFKVAARNSCGIGNFSKILPLRLTEVPSQMNVFTQAENCNLLVYWTVPDNGGDTILQYTLSVQQLNGQLVPLGGLCLTNPNNCPNGSCSCQISMESLKNYPYNLQDGQPVIIQGYATNSNGNGVISTPNSYGVIMQSVPSIMQPPRLITKTETTITLAWTSVFGQNTQGNNGYSYELLWDQGSGSNEFVTLGEYPNPSTTINLTPPLKQNYQFKLISRNPCGTSVPSQILPVQLATAPSQMICITTATILCDVRISWTEPNNGGAPIEQYNIEVMSASNTFLPLQACSGSQNLVEKTCRVPMAVLEAAPYYLTQDSLVVLRGKAFNNNGWSVLWSDPNISGSTIIASAPVMNAPYEVEGESSNTQMTISWNNPTSYNWQTGQYTNSLPVGTMYDLQQIQGNNIWTEAYIGLDTRMVVYIDQGNIRNYRFKVRAQSDCGWGDYSPELLITIETCPGAVTAQTAIENCSVRVSWASPYNGGLPISNYKIEISADPQNQGAWIETTACGGFQNQYTNTGANVNNYGYNFNNGSSFSTSYQNQCLISMDTLMAAPYFLEGGENILVRAQAYNERGWGQTTISGSNTSILSEPPNISLAPVLDYKTNRQITISWQDYFANGGIPNENNSYEVYYANDSNFSGSNLNWQQIDQIRETRFTFNIRDDNINAYSFRIRAFNQCGWGNFSPQLRVELAAKPYTMYPVVTTIQGCSVLVEWFEPQNGGSTITNYALRLCNTRIQSSNASCVSIDQICTQNSFTSGTSNTSCLIPMSALTLTPYKLVSGDLIVIQAAALNNVGRGEWSPVNESGVTMSAQPPQMNVPRLVHKTHVSMIVSWDAVTGLQQGQYSYELWWDSGNQGQFVQLTETDRLTYTVPGINSSLSYRFKVRARTACGYGMFSNELGITFYDVPDQMLPVVVSSEGCNARISWIEPANGGSQILRYRLYIQAHNSYSFVELDTLCPTDPQFTGEALPSTCLVPMSSLMVGDVGLQQGELIVVRISAQNAAGWGMQSGANYAGATIESGAPAMGVITVTQATQDYQLSWAHPVNVAQQFASNYGGYTYEIQSDNGSGGLNWTTIGSTPNNSFVVPNIDPGVSYQFRVKAINSCDSGSYSPVAVGEGVAAPGQIQPPLITLDGCTVVFTWGQVTSSGGALITTNQVAVADASGIYQPVPGCITSSEQASSCSVPYSTFTSAPFSLLPNTNTRIRARAAACNAFKCGPASNIGYSENFVITDINKPNPPRRVTTGAIYESLEDNEILLEWDTHFGAQSYDLRYQRVAPAGVIDTTLDTRQRTVLDNTAVNSFTMIIELAGAYKFSVSANNYCENPLQSGYSEPLLAEIAVKPTWVDNFKTVKYPTTCKVEFSWDKAGEDNVSEYKIQVKKDYSFYYMAAQGSDEEAQLMWGTIDMGLCEGYVPASNRPSCTVSQTLFWSDDYKLGTNTYSLLNPRIAALNGAVVGQWSNERGVGGRNADVETGLFTLKAKQVKNVEYRKENTFVTIEWRRLTMYPEDDGVFTSYEIYSDWGDSLAQMRYLTEIFDQDTISWQYSSVTDTYDAAKTYRFQVRGRNSCGDGPWSDFAQPISNIAPSQMSYVRISTQTDDVTFQWEHPAQSVEEYRFEVRNRDDTWVAISDGDCAKDPQAERVECTVTKNLLSTVYKVDTTIPIAARVIADNQYGDGDDWSLACLNPYRMEKPSDFDYSPTSITVEWEALAGGLTGDGPIIRYEVYTDNGSGGTVNTPVQLDNLLQTQQIFANLDTATEYQYKVRAVNKCGASEFSEVSKYSPKSCPSQQVAPTIESDGTDVVVSWTDPSPPVAGQTISNYKILWQNTSGLTQELDSCNGDDQAVIDSKSCSVPMTDIPAKLGLRQGDIVKVMVQASNSYCYSAASPMSAENDVTVIVCPDRMSLSPNVREDVTERKVTLRWEAVPLTESGGSAVTSYDIQYRVAGETDWNARPPTSQDYYIQQGLLNAVEYEFQVRADNSYCPGPWSATQSIATGAVPSTPIEVAVNAVAIPVADQVIVDCGPANNLRGELETPDNFAYTEEIEISWEMPADDNSNVQRYIVYILDRDENVVEYPGICDGADADVISTMSCRVPMATFWDAPLSLPKFELIVVQIQAVNAIGNSAKSLKNSEGASIATRPKQIEIFKAEKQRQEMNVDLTWDELTPKYRDGDSPITSYSIEYFALADDMTIADADIRWSNLMGAPGGANSGADYLPTVVPGTPAKYEHPDVPSDTTIFYRIRAKNIWGCSPYSEEQEIASFKVALAPLLNPYPTEIVRDVDNVAGTDIEVIKIKVNWEKSELVGDTKITAYEVEFRDAAGDWQEHASCQMSPITIYQHRTETQTLYCKVPMSAFQDEWGLTYDDLVVFRVRSRNVAGASDWSVLNDNGVVVEGKPAKMATIVRDDSVVSATRLAIEWAAAMTEEERQGTQVIANYVLEYSVIGANGPWSFPEPNVDADGEPTMDSTTGATDLTNYVLESADKGVEYCFQVAAVNIYGQGPWSDAECLELLSIPDAMDAPETSNPLTDVDKSEIIITWQADPEVLVPAITGYDLEFLRGDRNEWEAVGDDLCDMQALFDDDISECTVKALDLIDFWGYDFEDDTFTARIRAKNDSGAGEWSEASPTLNDNPASTYAQVSSEQQFVLSSQGGNGSGRLRVRPNARVRFGGVRP